ncbi:gonadotropin subunit beta-1-like [Syngnathus typhle]
MQLVVMATVLALALAGTAKHCSLGCTPRNVTIPVESCGRTEYVDTTVCEGQCYNEFPTADRRFGGDQTRYCVGSVLNYSLITRLCRLRDPVYLSPVKETKQKVCDGNWSYEVKHIRGCSVGVTYPVAKSCQCTSCNEDYTDCGRVPWFMPSCF